MDDGDLSLKPGAVGRVVARDAFDEVLRQSPSLGEEPADFGVGETERLAFEPIERFSLLAGLPHNAEEVIPQEPVLGELADVVEQARGERLLRVVELQEGRRRAGACGAADRVCPEGTVVKGLTVRPGAQHAQGRQRENEIPQSAEADDGDGARDRRNALREAIKA